MNVPLIVGMALGLMFYIYVMITTQSRVFSFESLCAIIIYPALFGWFAAFIVKLIVWPFN